MSGLVIILSRRGAELATEPSNLLLLINSGRSRDMAEAFPEISYIYQRRRRVIDALE